MDFLLREILFFIYSSFQNGSERRKKEEKERRKKQRKKRKRRERKNVYSTEPFAGKRILTKFGEREKRKEEREETMKKKRYLIKKCLDFEFEN